jgi:hypothetical protein
LREIDDLTESSGQVEGLMEQATIEVDDEELGRSAAGTVWGNIRLQIGEIGFPHMEWSDFVVAILDAWCRAALRLLQGEKGTAVVSFMEGPYLVELRSSAPGSWHASLVEDGSGCTRCGVVDGTMELVDAARAFGWPPTAGSTGPSEGRRQMRSLLTFFMLTWRIARRS